MVHKLLISSNYYVLRRKAEADYLTFEIYDIYRWYDRERV